MVIPDSDFQAAEDLYLAHFDSKTDVDDIHSIAGVATMLGDPRLASVRFHAVAGAYGTQGGLYVPANELFNAAFGRNWSDAHTDFDRALAEVTVLVAGILKDGGNIWIAEAGQSDFSAALVQNIKMILPGIDTRKRIHIVQHSEWNEGSTSPDKLAYVKEHTSYNKIPDGNAIGNGSPGLRVSQPFNWQNYITKPALVGVWEMALEIANRYNGSESRYTNAMIKSGGMDFSDVSETCWIFGFNDLRNVEAFFEEFATTGG
ncbi:MAG: hypothetical protein AB8G77_09200 [Rhodothermales bacterium]